ncbi:alpha-tocopherol transfer protein-like [Anopheles stephensi]|uniref:alpha-tocopherol transfer protein-like n=1 Tax=Anopheles stephensi TaxID=30069 RepID=UPI0016589291|nr:alpha-tocopherol transfer protein-like [Anopheles stephensi]
MSPNPLPLPCLEKVPESYDDEYEHPQGPESINKTLEVIREVDRSTVEQNLAQLRDWIAKHPHIRQCRTDARFLLRFLRARKHSFLAASQVLERYLAARILHPTWFQRLDIRDPELADLTDIGFLYTLKERDPDGCLVTLCDWGLIDPKRYTVDHSNRMHALLVEAFGDDPLFQCAGIIVIFDLQHIQLAHHSIVSLSVLRQVAQYVNNAIPIRCKAIHAVNVPSGALWIVNGLLGFLNEKIRNRCSLFRDYDELAEKFDRSLLPKEHGGKEPKSEHIRAFRERCERYRERMLLLDEMDIDLDHNEPYSRHALLDDIEGGAVGSFRKLELD